MAVRRSDNGRLLKVDMYKLRYGDPLMYEIAERFTSFAQERGYDPVGLAVVGQARQVAGDVGRRGACRE